MATMGKMSGRLVAEYFNEKTDCTKPGCTHKRDATSMYCRRHENRRLFIALASMATTAVYVVTTVILEIL